MTKDQVKNLVTKHRIDIIVVASLLLLSLLTLLIINLTRVEGAVAEVTVDGKTVGEYPLALDGVYELNGGTNVLTVKDGVAYMSYSNCPDHICENKGKIKYVGETITCLPNLLTVTVRGESDDAVDFVS